jgi:hypothetical protein
MARDPLFRVLVKRVHQPRQHETDSSGRKNDEQRDDEGGVLGHLHVLDSSPPYQVVDMSFLGRHAGCQEAVMRYEDPNDPERRAAVDFGHTVEEETSWFLEDEQQAINIVELTSFTGTRSCSTVRLRTCGNITDGAGCYG